MNASVFLVLGCVGFLCGCAADSSDEPSSESTEALASPGGGSARTIRSCKASLGACYLGCDTKYPALQGGSRTLSGEYLKACKDACDAEDRLCKGSPAR